MKNQNLKSGFSRITQPNTCSRPWNKGKTLPPFLVPFQTALQPVVVRGWDVQAEASSHTLWEVSLRIVRAVAIVKRISSFAPILSLDYFMHLAEVLQHMLSRLFLALLLEGKINQTEKINIWGAEEKTLCLLLKEKKKKLKKTVMFSSVLCLTREALV